MLISPSIASGNVLRLADEIAFCDEHFDAIHLDIADGVAVRDISFGFKACAEACRLSTASSKTIHLEIDNPVAHLDHVRQCDADMVFIQTDHVADPLAVLDRYQSAGIPTGANISCDDMRRRHLNDILVRVRGVLVGTTSHDDKTQACLPDMLEFARELAETGQHEVWIDGGITEEIVRSLSTSRIHAAVLGRAVFGDKAHAVEAFCLNR